MPRFPLALVAALTLAACGGSVGGGGDTTPSDLSPAVKAKWDAYCAAREACLPETMCATSACMARAMEEGPLEEFIECQNAKECGANDDDCYESAGTTDAEREAFVARCEATAGAITPSTTCYFDPIRCAIIGYPIVRKQIMRAVDACLSLSCPAMKTCMDAALEPLSCA